MPVQSVPRFIQGCALGAYGLAARATYPFLFSNWAFPVAKQLFIRTAEGGLNAAEGGYQDRDIANLDFLNGAGRKIGRLGQPFLSQPRHFSLILDVGSDAGEPAIIRLFFGALMRLFFHAPIRRVFELTIHDPIGRIS